MLRITQQAKRKIHIMALNTEENISISNEEILSTFRHLREQNFIFVDLDIISENIKLIRGLISKHTGKFTCRVRLTRLFMLSPHWHSSASSISCLHRSILKVLPLSQRYPQHRNYLQTYGAIFEMEQRFSNFRVVGMIFLLRSILICCEIYRIDNISYIY